MAGTIELAPLSERFDDAEIREIKVALKERGVPRIPGDPDADGRPIADGIDDDILSSFLDQLDDHDVACETYLPVEFEGTFEVGDLRVGSAQQLLDTLEELKDEFEVEADEDEEDEEADEREDDHDEEEEDEDDVDDVDMIRSWARQMWKVFFKAAKECIERKLPLHVYH
jgi:hypothetical protein